MKNTDTGPFYKLCLYTIVAVYFLILVGGIVRSTGSGMGCPDWPTCFGRIVPPTSAGQLPADYKEVYAAYRHNKNIKFANYLTAIGMGKTAQAILNDETIREEADFNAVKTWVEYVNRLVGVTIGLFIVMLFWRSWKFRQSRPSIFWLSLITLLAVIFQGWFGSIVVSTNLTQWTITVHLFLALGIVIALIYLLYISNPAMAKHVTGGGSLSWIAVACMLTLLIQIFWGTEVRAAVDRLTSTLPRSAWMENMGFSFFFHRSFSWMVLLVHLVLLWKWQKAGEQKTFRQVFVFLLLATLASGAAMAYWGVPAILQPVHLLLASLVLGALFYLFLNSYTSVYPHDYRTTSDN